MAYAGYDVRAWRDLERIWQLAAEPLAVERYIVAETRAFLADPEGAAHER